MSASTFRDELSPPKRKRLITTRGVCEIHHVTPRTISRWRKNPKLNFPKPAKVINGRNYWDEEEAENWAPPTGASKEVV